MKQHDFIQNNTEETLSEVFEFLEISKQDINDLTKQNKIGYPKMKDSTREVLNNFFILIYWLNKLILTVLLKLIYVL